MGNDKEVADKEAESTPPAWLNAAFIQEALRRAGEENYHVVRLKIRAATAPGDNYSSTLLRVTATLPDNAERSLLVKVPPPGEAMLNAIMMMGVFRRETNMLARIVPEMEDALNAAAPNRYAQLAPRCPHHGTSPTEFLVLEDLTPQGFKMADRQRGLGLRHCIITLKALARFHGASVLLLQRNPDIEKTLGQPWQLSKGTFDEYNVSAIRSTIDVCREFPDFQEITDRLVKFKAKAMQTFIDLQDPRPGGFNVITHGDFWSNNILFRYEDGLPQEVRLVDFQYCHVTSPVMDLHYFLTTSPSEEVSSHYEDLLIREYHKALVEVMELLGLKPPPIEALLADINASGAFAVFGTARLMPLVKSVKVADIDSAITGDEESGAYLYKSLPVKKCLQRVLPMYNQRGWLS